MRQTRRSKHSTEGETKRNLMNKIVEKMYNHVTQSHHCNPPVRLNDSLSFVPFESSFWGSIVSSPNSLGMVNVPKAVQTSCTISYNHWKTKRGPVDQRKQNISNQRNSQLF